MTALINVVGAAVVDSLATPTRLLAARRTAPPQFAGMWEFPGGKVEAGEAPEAALHRELAEELGIEVQLGAELTSGSDNGWRLNERASMRVWFAEVTAGEPQPLEDHDELHWIPLDNCDEALNLPWIPADLPIVRALLDRVGAPAGEHGVSMR
ncbi:8-oxo-dGTP diphosphatase [Arthrobacter sp. cf158]|uniref:(deoxy)nucleoside triphosphate pyrophosphohydrolase n=1 Tax=Arthrobacter sp. cf158 TaxID=1761744 RepID=UPI0008978D8E|nr:(deoxy)nucleoside triphosphate pyrophosphohydrolase [Arthrobacter sp. cf158]SDX42605.1 8-oxo-dGTP diphosphatase [Arthrobacter sp. cf158]